MSVYVSFIARKYTVIIRRQRDSY